MKPSIILYKALPDDLLHHLEERFTVTQVPNLRPETVAQHTDAFVNVEGPLSFSGAVNTALLGKMPRLHVTSTISVGYDSFNIDALNVRKALLMHTPAVLTETVADTVTAPVSSTAHRVVEVAEWVKVDEWTESIGPDWFGIDAYHRAPGAVGMGRTGLALVQRAHFGFSMPILYNAHHHHQEAEERFNVRYCDLDTLLQESDFVCLILPLTDGMRHLFSTGQFTRMKSSVIFVNAGRGPVVNEETLTATLQKGEIHAAGLGASEQEPLPVDSPLLSLSNVAAAPHVGSVTRETHCNVAACAVDDLISAPQGHVGESYVNPWAAS